MRTVLGPGDFWDMDHRATARGRGWLRRGPRPPSIQSPLFFLNGGGSGGMPLHLQQVQRCLCHGLLVSQGGTGQPLEVSVTAPRHEDPQPLLLTVAKSLRDGGISLSPAALCSGPRAPPADSLSPFATLELPWALALWYAGGKEDGCAWWGSRNWKKMFLQGRVFG